MNTRQLRRVSRVTAYNSDQGVVCPRPGVGHFTGNCQFRLRPPCQDLIPVDTTILASLQTHSLDGRRLYLPCWPSALGSASDMSRPHGLPLVHSCQLLLNDGLLAFPQSPIARIGRIFLTPRSDRGLDQPRWCTAHASGTNPRLPATNGSSLKLVGLNMQRPDLCVSPPSSHLGISTKATTFSTDGKPSIPDDMVHPRRETFFLNQRLGELMYPCTPASRANENRGDEAHLPVTKRGSSTLDWMAFPSTQEQNPYQLGVRGR